MHPAGPPPPQNRSCPSPSIAPCPSPSPSLIQQQQQHVLYGPITTLQHCSANLHPHCVYTGVQRNPRLPGDAPPLTNQVPIRQTKGAKWQPKSKPPRGHQQSHHHHYHHQHQPSHLPQYCQPLPQQHVQPQLSYIPKPLVLFDHCPTNPSAPAAPPGTPLPSASFLVASSAFTNAPYASGDPYTSASGLTLIPQPYFKPPDIPQAFCLLPERPQPPQPPQQHQQPYAAQNPGYYNISNGVQTANSKPGFQLTNVVNPYTNLATFAGGQISAGQAAAAQSQVYPNAPVTVTFGGGSGGQRDKLSTVSCVDAQVMTCSRNLAIPGVTKQQQSQGPRQENVEWPGQTTRETLNMFEVANSERTPRIQSPPVQGSRISSSTKSQEERYSDESAASFDFTIEAEKMVSALCNTASSNDIKDVTGARHDDSPSFSGAAGDNVTNKTNIWFADFCTEYGVSLADNCRNTGTQTRENRDDLHLQCPESMRKTIYWGCDEAESILNSGNYRCSSRSEWLGNISRATRTAVTKSSTCFPIFSGDRTFVQDLINALLRISNGWLVLDNYLNKQHYPSLGEKFDGDLMHGFRAWEVATYDLLRELVRTFVKIEENDIPAGSASLESIGRQENQSNNSFPGDVSLYTNCDLFDSSQGHRENVSKVNADGKNDRDSTYTLQYATQSTSHPNLRSYEAQPHTTQKETKLRSKWTITENLSSTMDTTRSIPETSLVPSDLGFPGTAKYRQKTGSTIPSTKISSSTRHSLNAEFFHLRNKVMETMGSSIDPDRQGWGLKDHHQYDIVFGSSAIPTSASNEPIYRFRAPGSVYENSYNPRRLPRIDSTVSTNQSPSQRANSTSVFLVTGATEAAMDSTYVAAGPSRVANNPVEPVYTGASECTDHNCGSGSLVASVAEPVYVGKTSAGQLVSRPKMTLLSQIEGNATTSSGRDTKEMTASLSAWFASMRNPSANRAILNCCPVEGRKNETPLVPRTSTHPQESSRSAMDLNRQLRMDGNRQLQTLQNMQTIQSQPWNACNLLNGKRATCKTQHVDEYDSSEDVRVYMKPGSYNVPKKRHHRKNGRRLDNPVSSRAGNSNTPRAHINRTGSGMAYNSTGSKNHQMSASVSSLMISSSVQVSSTTSGTTAAVKVSYPPNPLVSPTTSLPLESSPMNSYNTSVGKNHQISTTVSSLVISSSVQVSTTAANSVASTPATQSLEDSPRILRRVRSNADQDASQDVAWKAACASAEILLEALNVKESFNGGKRDGGSHSSVEETLESRDRCLEPVERFEADKRLNDGNFCGASSYEASEDDSDSTCKLSAHSQDQPKPRDVRQHHPKTNVKTDSWLIRTLNNASIVSKINGDDESDADSTIGEFLDMSSREDRRERQTVVTSTPEPAKNPENEDSSGSTVVDKDLEGSFQEKTDGNSPRGWGSRERSTSSSRQALSALMADTSGELAGRATYSETVRRSTVKSGQSGKKDSGRSRQTRSSVFGAARSSVLPVPGRKEQRKEDKTFQMICKSGKTSGKRTSRDPDEKIREDVSGDNASRVSATRTKKKEDVNSEWPETKSKTGDRGWSVWYSSRRRQTLTPHALKKLAAIHQTVWQMDDAHVLKYPAAGSNAVGALSETIEDSCKITKNEMFLETIGYKLKNRVYHKVEHVIRDFRRIIKNSKMYHKNDTDRLAKIETLSRKLEELFDEHFSALDFESVLDSPRDDNSCTAQASKQKSPQRLVKSAASRFPTTAKKSPAKPSKNEN